MVFSSEKGLGIIYSDFFGSRSSSAIPREMSVSILNQKFSTSPLVETAPDGSLVAWEPGTGRLIILEKAGAASSDRNGPAPSAGEQKTDQVKMVGNSLQHVEITGDELIAIGNNGTLRLYSLPGFNNEFYFNIFGIRTAAIVEKRIVIGKSGSTGVDAPLLLVDRRTKETIPLSYPGVMVFDTAYDSSTGRLYTLGIEETDNETSTVCRLYWGDNFERNRLLFSFPGEDLAARVVLDPETSAVYTSIGYGGIQGYVSGKKVTFEQRENNPRELYVFNGRLYALNKDHSISVWDLKSEARVLDFYYFIDDNWIALLSSGKFYSSEGASKYLAFYNDIEPVSDIETDEFRQN
jgi:hypothetical protein